MENTQMQRVESLMKEMELILSSSSKEFQELGVKESTVKKNYEKSLDVIQETKKKLFKKENKLKSKLKKDLKNISNRKYYLIQEFQKAQLKKPEELCELAVKQIGGTRVFDEYVPKNIQLELVKKYIIYVTI